MTGGDSIQNWKCVGNDVVSWSMKLFNGLRRIKKSKMNDGKTFHCLHRRIKEINKAVQIV